MALDTLDQRIAEIAVSENDKTTLNNNKKLNITITQKVPFLVIPDITVTENTVVSITTTAPTDTSTIVNTLVDTKYTNDNGVDRFTYITTATSPITYAKNRLYFDALYSDIIIIPDTIFFGSADADDPMNNKTLDVTGTVVGIGDFTGRERASLKISMNENTTKIKEPVKTNIDNTMHILNLLGVSNGKSPGNHGKMFNGGNDYLEKDPFKPLGVIDLGDVTNLLDTTGKPLLPANYIYQISEDTYEHRTAGNVRLSNIKIAISF